MPRACAIATVLDTMTALRGSLTTAAKKVRSSFTSETGRSRRYDSELNPDP
jgi:hypothetical protein